MSDEIRITVLMENSVRQGGLAAEHGLSFFIRTGGRNVLFDTGQTSLLLGNAARLGLPLDRLDAIVLSHGHYDHTGGLAAVCGLAARARIFLHPSARREKFTQKSGAPVRSIGLPDAGGKVLEASAGRVVETRSCMEVVPGVFVTGEIPRVENCENTGGSFFLDAACQHADPLHDDQALFIESRDGIVVLLGCAHSGVMNTLRHIDTLTGGRPVHAVLGGMHLLNAGPERVERTLAALERLQLGRIAPGHCTGWTVMPALQQRFGNRCVPCDVGSVHVFAGR